MTEWERGIQAFQEGRLRESADRLASAAADHERTVSLAARCQTLAFLGAAQYALGLPADAVTSFENVVRLTPGALPAPLLVNLANAYLATSQSSKARETLKKALDAAPGDTEAQMLLQRLDSAPDGKNLRGAMLGESPESVQNYIRTLSFPIKASGGYEPNQVRQALTQISRYIDLLVTQLAERDETVARQQAELENARRVEDALIAGFAASPALPPPEDPSLSPLERLFQSKPA